MRRIARVSRRIRKHKFIVRVFISLEIELERVLDRNANGLYLDTVHVSYGYRSHLFKYFPSHALSNFELSAN